MKYFIPFILLCSCATVPNVPLCVHDGPESAYCAWTIQTTGNFHVDDSGLNNYTQQGRNWNLDQLNQNSLILPPDSWSAIKAFILQTCKDYPSECQTTNVQSNILRVETQLRN